MFYAFVYYPLIVEEHKSKFSTNFNMHFLNLASAYFYINDLHSHRYLGYLNLHCDTVCLWPSQVVNRLGFKRLTPPRYHCVNLP